MDTNEFGLRIVGLSTGQTCSLVIQECHFPRAFRGNAFHLPVALCGVQVSQHEQATQSSALSNNVLPTLMSLKSMFPP